MIQRDGITYAWTRDATTGKMVEAEVPSLGCPTRTCSRLLTLERELHQSGTQDIAWLLTCGNHRFFYHPTKRRELVRMR
jgi:hypothetical protein